MIVFFKFPSLLYLKLVIAEKNKIVCTKIIFICVYRFFDPNSESINWPLKWAECIPLIYGRSLWSISSHNIIVFFKFFCFLYLKMVLAEKNKVASAKIIFICLYIFFDPNSERKIWHLKWAECISPTYKSMLSSISIHNMIVFSIFLASWIWKWSLQKKTKWPVHKIEFFVS